MKILIINNAEAGITEFVQPVKEILERSGFFSELAEYRDCRFIQFNKYDGVVLSGSPQGDDIVEHHQPFFQWIKTFEKPVFGICAGHHITGYLYGSRYLRGEEPEQGNVIVTCLKDDPVFSGIPEQFQVRQMHHDSVTLPAGFIHLARSKTCINQAMRHAVKPLYTVQFHPEYLNPEILLNFVELCRRNKNSRDSGQG